MVTAQVQGSRPRPYRVRLGLAAFGKAQWAALERALAASAWYSAKLLAGEMPPDIEEVFGAQGLSLFPASAGDLSMDCSCPDWEVPCKHIAAVFYLLAEAFDEDPFAILAWRGRERQELLANLDAVRDGPPVSGPAGAGSPAAGSGDSGSRDSGSRDSGSRDSGAGRVGAPLADSLGSFFALAGELPVASPPVTVSGSLLSQVPPVAVTVRGHPLTELLGPAYRAFGAEDVTGA
jgi:hypothetical protein